MPNDRKSEAIEAAAGYLLATRWMIGNAEAETVASRTVEAYEQVMRPLVEDVAGLDALPVGSVVLNQEGSAWRKGGRNWYITGYAGGQKAVPYLPARVLHRGDQ